MSQATLRLYRRKILQASGPIDPRSGLPYASYLAQELHIRFLRRIHNSLTSWYATPIEQRQFVRQFNLPSLRDRRYTELYELDGVGEP